MAKCDMVSKRILFFGNVEFVLTELQLDSVAILSEFLGKSGDIVYYTVVYIVNL